MICLGLLYNNNLEPIQIHFKNRVRVYILQGFQNVCKFYFHNSNLILFFMSHVETYISLSFLKLPDMSGVGEFTDMS